LTVTTPAALDFQSCGPPLGKQQCTWLNPLTQSGHFPVSA
jgi:hypothetical protein